MGVINLRGGTYTSPVASSRTSLLPTQTTAKTAATSLAPVTQPAATSTAPATTTAAPTTTYENAPNSTITTGAGGGVMPLKLEPFNDNQIKGMDMLSNTPYFSPEYAASFLGKVPGLIDDATNFAKQGVNVGNEWLQKGNQAFDPTTMITPYMNPYIESVVKPAMDRLRLERDKTQSDIAEGASRVGAFGGTREGVERSLNDEAFDRNSAETVGNLYYTGYNDARNSALGQFNQERNRNLQSSEIGAGQNFNAANSINNAISSALSGSRQAQSLGDTTIDRYRTAASDALTAGQMQQDLGQKQLDATYNEQYAPMKFNMNQILQALKVLGSYPTGTSKTLNEGGSNILSNLGAVGAGVASDYADRPWLLGL